jgi:hypothetical protein
MTAMAPRASSRDDAIDRLGEIAAPTLGFFLLDRSNLGASGLFAAL